MTSNYFEAAGIEAMLDNHPIGTDFENLARSLSRDELFARQDRLFRRCVERAWQTGFYRRLWSRAGAEPGDIRGLADIGKLPVFDKSDLMDSIAAHPPFGDFGGFDPGDADHEQVIFHTTSGTTGRPQPLLFGAKSREVQNLLLGRIYRLQGISGSDVVHSVYGHGPINGGHYVREAVLHWTNAIFLSAGTGVETPSARQVELMRDFGVTVIVGFADYLKRLAEAAAEQGLIMGDDIRVRMISGQMGRENRAAISELWGGAQCYDWYGVGDTGIIAGEGPDRDGLYVMEDAHYLELLDVDTGTPVGTGGQGDMVCTCLFKDDIYPIVRFNTHDVTMERPGTSALGFNLRRIEGFLGRSDNMVKIKGINVFPQAVGPVLDELPEFLGEFVCRVTADGGFVVVAEVSGAGPELPGRMRELLKNKLGIAVDIELVERGGTASLTEVDRRQKPIRLVDERG